MLIQKLYAIEAELRKKTDGTAEDRREYRQQHSQPVMQQLYKWLNQHHLTVPSSSPTAKAINYTLKRCVNGNLKLTPFTLKQQSKIDPFDDLLRLNLWLNSYSLFIF